MNNTIGQMIAMWLLLMCSCLLCAVVGPLVGAIIATGCVALCCLGLWIEDK